MKLSMTYALLASCACMSNAFSPMHHTASLTTQQRQRGSPLMDKPFFASSEEPKAEPTAAAAAEEETIDQEVERLVAEEMETTKKISNLRNANGVEYAPWMNISKEEEEKIRIMMKEKAEARRKRQEQEKDVRGNLLVDSQAGELSGTGLRGKIIDGNSVELEWATAREASTKGYLIKRRAAKTPDFETIASYETYGPLASQGPDGGIYRFLDQDLAPGGYFYRVTECEVSGAESDLSQCLVEIQTEEEQRGAVIAAVSVGAVLVGLALVAALLDPMQ